MSKKIAVIGSGLIGRCWAMMFARAGYTVALYDISAEQVSAALISLKQQLTTLAANDLLDGQSVDEVAARVSGSSSLEKAIKDAVHCQECCPENLDLKKKIFSDLNDAADDQIVLASSTSCIAASTFTGQLSHKSQCLVAHPVNPPHFIPLVEIVPAPWTKPEVVERTVALMKDIGQSPVTLKKEANGFLLNRLQYALLMEAWRCVEDGICSPEDCDTAVSKGLGTRWSFMGPFETIDLNAPGGVKDYCERYGENITAICAEQDKAGARSMTSATADVIHAAMRKAVPESALGDRKDWRDARLAALFLHKKERVAIESGKRKASVQAPPPSKNAASKPYTRPAGLDDHQITYVEKRRRCVVCCSFAGCEAGTSEKHSRHGRQTAFGCRTCFLVKNAGKPDLDPNSIDSIVPLCRVARYKKHGDDRSCFQIYHEEGPYPIYCGIASPNHTKKRKMTLRNMHENLSIADPAAPAAAPAPDAPPAAPAPPVAPTPAAPPAEAAPAAPAPANN